MTKIAFIWTGSSSEKVIIFLKDAVQRKTRDLLVTSKLTKGDQKVSNLLVLGQSKMGIPVFCGNNIFSRFSGAQNGDMPAVPSEGTVVLISVLPR